MSEVISAVPINDRYEEHREMSLAAIDQYRRELAWMESEPLTPEDEARFFERLVRSAREPENAHFRLLAKDARDRLVKWYQPLVLFLARKYLPFAEGMELLDLVNEGSIGLMKALDEYPHRPEFHGEFRALVPICIRHALSGACSYRGSLVRLPAEMKSLLVKMRRASRQFEQTEGFFPSSDHLASVLHVPVERVREASFYADRAALTSLEALAYEDEQVEESHRLESPFHVAQVEESDRQKQVAVLIERVFEQVLTQHQQQVLRMRFGLHGSIAAESNYGVARLLGVSSVSCAYMHAIVRLRQVLEPVLSADQEVSVLCDQFQECYTVNEVAALLGISPSTVRAYVTQGRLPSYRGVSRTGGRKGCERTLFPKPAIDALVSGARSALADQSASA